MTERGEGVTELLGHDVLTGDDDGVRLTVPASSDYLRTVRLVAADAAVRAGLDCHEVEDFRIAVDEVCHLLMASTDHPVSVMFDVVGDQVIARGSARGREGAAPRVLDDLSQTIVRSVADEYETANVGSDVTFRVAKHARSTNAPTGR